MGFNSAFKGLNNFHLDYKNQLVNPTQGYNNCFFFSIPHKKHIRALCAGKVQFLNAKRVVTYVRCSPRFKRINQHFSFPTRCSWGTPSSEMCAPYSLVFCHRILRLTCRPSILIMLDPWKWGQNVGNKLPANTVWILTVVTTSSYIKIC